LKKVLRRCPNATWTPEFVRQALETGQAGLFVCEGGFLILEVDYEAGHRFLNVWIAWFKPNYAKEHRQELIAWLDEARKELACEWWQFSSPREGWIGIEPDCERAMTIWRRK
jgi:hypothetical protein